MVIVMSRQSTEMLVVGWESSEHCTKIECEDGHLVAELLHKDYPAAPEVRCGEGDEAPGGLDAILRTQGRFTIDNCDRSTMKACLQISRNLMQYYGADAEIVEEAGQTKGNVVTVIVGDLWSKFQREDLPAQVNVGYTSVMRKGGGGFICLGRLGRGRLQLIIWGDDAAGLDLMTRLVPTITGAGQPDFVVMDRSARWKGVGGALSMGFFNHDWSRSKVEFAAIST